MTGDEVQAKSSLTSATDDPELLDDILGIPEWARVYPDKNTYRGCKSEEFICHISSSPNCDVS